MPESIENNRVRRQHQRDGGSVIATFGRGDVRHVEVFTPPLGLLNAKEEGGRTGEASMMAADFCRSLGPDWRLLSLSTPSTILSDLRGRQPNGRPPRDPAVQTGFNSVERPEYHMLRRPADRDLLA